MRFYVTLPTGNHANDVMTYSALKEAKLACINTAMLANMNMVSVNATRKLEKAFNNVNKRTYVPNTSLKFKT